MGAAMEVRAAERLARFPGFLRANGFGIAGGDAVQALHAAERTGVLDPDFGVAPGGRGHPGERARGA